MVLRHGLWETTDLSKERERDDIVLYVAVVWREILRGDRCHRRVSADAGHSTNAFSR